MSIAAAVLGSPVSHSLSPRLHDYWLRKHGLKGKYVSRETGTDALQATLSDLAKNGAHGVNLTIPLKEKALMLMHSLSVEAQRIKAVNTVVFRDGKYHGHNTDGYGFITHLKNSAPDRRLGTALVLGAGGAARSIVCALQEEGFEKIFITNRTSARAEKLATEFPTQYIDWENKETILPEVDVLVNTTSLGMQDQPPLEINISALPKRAAVMDIVYKPLETKLLNDARSNGLQAIDGLGMLLHQGAAAFAEWFSILPEVTPELEAYMREAL